MLGTICQKKKRKTQGHVAENGSKRTIDFGWKSWDDVMTIARNRPYWKTLSYLKIIAYLPTLQIFPGVSKFFIKSPGLIFREYSCIVLNDILTMQRFLDVSRFLYSGGWQVCHWANVFQVYQNAIYLNLLHFSIHAPFLLFLCCF